MTAPLRKTCTLCHKRKPLRAFHKRSATTWRHDCKACVAKRAERRREKDPKAHLARSRETLGRFRARHPDYQKNYDLKRHYGISLEEYEALLASQKHRCAICRRRSPDRRRLHVDHDHSTGTVRGLLCTKCNLGLGCFCDEVTSLEAAIRYLLGGAA